MQGLCDLSGGKCHGFEEEVLGVFVKTRGEAI
jgi:hypothetical protein